MMPGGARKWATKPGSRSGRSPRTGATRPDQEPHLQARRSTRYDFSVDVLCRLCDDPAGYRQLTDELLAQGFVKRAGWDGGLDVTNFIDLVFTKTYVGPGGEPLKLQFRTRFESRYYRQILYTLSRTRLRSRRCCESLELFRKRCRMWFTASPANVGRVGSATRQTGSSTTTCQRSTVGGQSGCAITSSGLACELTRERLDEARALYAWVDGRYEAAPSAAAA